jgi:galactose mutarotase-like enzyme
MVPARLLRASGYREPATAPAEAGPSRSPAQLSVQSPSDTAAHARHQAIKPRAGLVQQFAMRICAITMFLALASPLAAGSGEVVISGKELSVTVANKGAELQSIRHLPTGIEYLWQGDPEYWRNRAPNMFPVNVRFKDNRFTYKGKPYEMPRMGVAMEADFKLLEDTGNPQSVVHVLQSTDDSLKHYPFPFRLEVTSAINGLTLIQRYRVTNLGSETMYFALGGHPGFRTPLDDGRTRGDYQYVFSMVMKTDRNVISNSLVTNTFVPYLDNEDRLSLDDDRIPDGGMFLQDHDSRQIGVALKGRKPYVSVDLQDFPNTNLWSPPGMPYACIEPMVAHHDFEKTKEAIEEKTYLISLPAGESRTYQYTITIDPEEGAKALN